MAHTAVNPPAAAAFAPVAIVSLCSPPGLTEMDVDIDQARRHHQSPRVDLANALGRIDPVADLGDHSVHNEYVSMASIDWLGSMTRPPRISNGPLKPLPLLGRLGRVGCTPREQIENCHL